MDPKTDVIPDLEQTDEEWREQLANLDAVSDWSGYYDGDPPTGCPPPDAFAGNSEDRYDEESFP